MKLLVTGASGLLGAHLTAGLAPFYDVVGVDRHPWWGETPVRWIEGDLARPGFAARLVREEKPDGILHCAAMAHVDSCERDSAGALRANVEITKELAASVPAGALFVYISTDGIFRGETPFAKEDDPPFPLTVYGRTKLQGEGEVRRATPNHLILRTNFYGWSSGRKQTSAEWLYASLEREEPITLFEDYFFTPIYVVHLTERLLELLTLGFRGILHLGGSERVSKSRFAEKLAGVAGFSLKNARRGFLREAPLRVTRPKDMSLDCGRYVQLTGRKLPTCQEGLIQFVQDQGKPLGLRFPVISAPGNGR